MTTTADDGSRPAVDDVGSAVGDPEAMQAAFDRAAVGVAFISPGGRWLRVNRRLCALTGYSESELLQRTFADITHRDDVERGLQLLAELKDGRIDEIEAEKRYIHKDGSELWVNVRSSAVRDCDGNLEFMVSVLEDISERKRTELALAASQDKFAKAFHTSPDSVNINRMSDGLYLEINEGFTRLTGYTAADVAGRTSTDISIWNDPADRERLVSGLRTRGTVHNLEAQFRRKDGSLTTALMSAQPLEIDGEMCILSVTRDISDRKAAEQALREREEELRVLLQRMGDTLTSVIEVVGTVSEMRDPYTGGHQRRVAELAVAIASDMGMPNNTVADIRVAGLMHDVGKMSVPAEILSRPGRLSREEFVLVQGHSAAGQQIISAARVHHPIPEMVYQHHERCDGSGYPRGLTADDLLPGSKVLMVADVVEAMSSHRPYRPALGIDAALAEIEAGAGTLYDLSVADSCVRIVREESFRFSEE